MTSAGCSSFRGLGGTRGGAADTPDNLRHGFSNPPTEESEWDGLSGCRSCMGGGGGGSGKSSSRFSNTSGGGGGRASGSTSGSSGELKQGGGGSGSESSSSIPSNFDADGLIKSGGGNWTRADMEMVGFRRMVLTWNPQSNNKMSQLIQSS